MAGQNKRLTGLLPESTRAGGVVVHGLENHENLTKGVIQGFKVDFKTLSLAKAKRIAKKLELSKVKDPFLIVSGSATVRKKEK